jgi:hypothetical protein
MAITGRNTIKSWFLTGYKPTQGQFASFIDSCFNLNDDTITIGMVSGLSAALATITAAITAGTAVPFAVLFSFGEAGPIVIDTWVADYFPTFKNGFFLVMLKNDDGTLQVRYDIQPERVIDRSGAEPVQTGITLDITGFTDGQLLIFYSNIPLI